MEWFGKFGCGFPPIQYRFDLNIPSITWVSQVCPQTIPMKQRLTLASTQCWFTGKSLHYALKNISMLERCLIASHKANQWVIGSTTVPYNVRWYDGCGTVPPLFAQNDGRTRSKSRLEHSSVGLVLVVGAVFSLVRCTWVCSSGGFPVLLSCGGAWTQTCIRLGCFWVWQRRHWVEEKRSPRWTSWIWQREGGCRLQKPPFVKEQTTMHKTLFVIIF